MVSTYGKFDGLSQGWDHGKFDGLSHGNFGGLSHGRDHYKFDGISDDLHHDLRCVTYMESEL